jgi:hypothetical protein
MPLSGLLEEVAGQAAGDGAGLKGATSVTDGSEDGTGTGLKFREPSISAAAQPAELGWEEQPSALAVGELDADGNMKEVGSLQVRATGCMTVGAASVVLLLHTCVIACLLAVCITEVLWLELAQGGSR